MSAFLTDLFCLHGRTALVTGASSGIGREIAGALARAGAGVILVARTEDHLRRATEEIAAEGATAHWFTADLGDRQSVREVSDAVERYAEPDILVNAAGINLRPPMDELTDADWDRTMAVNLDAPFLLGQRFGPAMARRGWGRIINLASQQTVRAFGNSGAYGVSKAGLSALTRSQAEAWSPHGVCANAIAPGLVHTPLTEPVFSDPVRTEAMARRTMTGRNGLPQDFTGVAVFLASRASEYVTGQTLFVDGGFSAT